MTSSSPFATACWGRRAAQSVLPSAGGGRDQIAAPREPSRRRYDRPKPGPPGGRASRYLQVDGRGPVPDAQGATPESRWVGSLRWPPYPAAQGAIRDDPAVATPPPQTGGWQSADDLSPKSPRSLVQSGPGGPFRDRKDHPAAALWALARGQRRCKRVSGGMGSSRVSKTAPRRGKWLQQLGLEICEGRETGGHPCDHGLRPNRHRRARRGCMVRRRCRARRVVDEGPIYHLRGYPLSTRGCESLDGSIGLRNGSRGL